MDVQRRERGLVTPEAPDDVARFDSFDVVGPRNDTGVAASERHLHGRAVVVERVLDGRKTDDTTCGVVPQLHTYSMQILERKTSADEHQRAEVL